MADGHVGYVMPIGGVAAYRDTGVRRRRRASTSPAATRRSAPTSTLARPRRERRRGASSLRTSSPTRSPGTVSFGIGPEEPRRRRARRTIRCSRTRRGTPCPPKHRGDAAGQGARSSSAPSGSGNHYVDVFADETGALWVGVHFGSRAASATPSPRASSRWARGETWGERVPETEVLLDARRSRGPRLLARS